MFSSWFQQAKELVSPPAVQMGQPLSNSESATKKKKVDESGEMTEEGFVCVGRSSFYSGTSPVVEQPAVPYTYGAVSNQHMPQYPTYPPMQFQGSGPHQMYPELPTPVSNMHYQKTSDSSSLDQVHECLRHVPFVLHPNLRPSVKVYDPKLVHSNIRNIDWSQFDYDFEFERRVLHEIQQCYTSSG